MNEHAVQITKEMTNFESDSDWFYKNIETMRKKGFIGKFVAIKKGEIIASGVDFALVVKMVENKGLNPAYVVIEFVYPEGTIILF